MERVAWEAMSESKCLFYTTVMIKVWDSDGLPCAIGGTAASTTFDHRRSEQVTYFVPRTENTVSKAMKTSLSNSNDRFSMISSERKRKGRNAATYRFVLLHFYSKSAVSVSWTERIGSFLRFRFSLIGYSLDNDGIRSRRKVYHQRFDRWFSPLVDECFLHLTQRLHQMNHTKDWRRKEFSPNHSSSCYLFIFMRSNAHQCEDTFVCLNRSSALYRRFFSHTFPAEEDSFLVVTSILLRQ